MLETSGRYYFIDMGTPPIDRLVTSGIAVDAVKGIFITHMHGDHTNGLIPFVDLIGWYYKTADPTICLPDIEAVKAIESWIKITEGIVRELRFVEICPGVIFDDGFMRVTAIPTLHTVRSYAFLLEAERKSVVFTGDLKHPDKDFPAIAKARETDLIVCESAHFEATDYLPHLKECKTKRVYVNHYQGKKIPSVLRLADEMGDVPVKLAYDGSEIIL
jgi:Metal-dependent hydrolases of the beta-lactamase superfamily III